MARPKRKLKWIKFYINETLEGSTSLELTAAQESVWWRLCLLAGRWDDKGIIHTERGRIPQIIGRPRRLVERTIQRCLEPEVDKILITKEGKVCVKNFMVYNPEKWEVEYYGKEKGVVQNKAEYSRIKQSVRPGLIKERVKKDIKERTKKEKSARAREGTNHSPPIHSLEKDPEDQPLIAKLWEQLTSRPVPPLLWQEFRPYENTDPEILDYAFREAARRNIDKWPYIKKIIDRRSGKEGAVQDSYSPRDPEGEAKLAADCLARRESQEGDCHLEPADAAPYRYCDFCPKWSE